MKVGILSVSEERGPAEGSIDVFIHHKFAALAVFLF